MVERATVIKNRAGIHARPAALIVQTAGKYKSRVFLDKDGERVNAKSIMGIITLGAGYDTKIVVVAEGEDEEAAAEAVAQLFDRRFEEE
ncbi:MAG TPA: HPr family phosphocarrier protein [Spirochaetales bacterium]|nr:HPr family phosphocarrier protein [Spirochaetales bacterium]MBP7263252.1 HPr family phosphocarrier protein [Spirochaetia bacterium]HPE36167.1 HPr family phosphocarrier protein [Spirochaetales bacterium]